MTHQMNFELGGLASPNDAGVSPGEVAAQIGVERSALFSACGTHRLALERRTGPGRTALFVGVNPSKAGAEFDDPTITKLYGFGARLGIGEWLVGNKFTLVSTDPVGLMAAPPLHPEGNAILRAMLSRADLVIVGWGALGKLPPELRTRWREVVMMAGGRPLYCWGTCADGHPRHPGRIAYSTPLVRWHPPA